MPEKPIRQSTRGPNEPAINGTCLMLINPSEASYGASITKKRGGSLYPLFHSTLMSFKHGDIDSHWAGPCVGSPMAVITVEKLITLGMKKLIVFGWCGSLTAEMQIGDLFIPKFGCSDEGVSSHYPLPEKPETSEDIGRQLQSLFPDTKTGPIWTTDAPFRELPSEIKLHRENGMKAVDMEFTALCTVCNFYSIEIAGMMVVSDELYHATWQNGSHGKKFKKKAKTALNTLMDNLPS